MDVYIRFKGDTESDYCFNLPLDATVDHFNKIAHRLPVVLRPSWFYDRYPEGWGVSVHPGYLTEEGTLLFGEEADDPKWIRWLDDTTKVSEVGCESMLYIPKWRWNNERHILFLTVLTIWLYLDIPEFLTPTPGVAPSVLVLKLLRYMVPGFLTFPDDNIFSTKWFQIIFFVLHTLKVLGIYGAFYIGFFNPFSVIPGNSKTPSMPTTQELSDLGWTSSRRLAHEDWPFKYRDHRIERVGGVVKAYRLGLLEKPIGVWLHEGEGFNYFKNGNKLPKVNPETLLTADGKFVPSQRYFEILAKPLAALLSSDASISTKVQRLKDFRSFGYLDSPSELRDLYERILPTHSEKKD